MSTSKAQVFLDSNRTIAPISHLLFGGFALGEPSYLELWAQQRGSPTTEEVIRNLPIRHPVLWITTGQGSGDRR